MIIRPYVVRHAGVCHYQDAVDMVRHHDEFIQRHLREMRRNVTPALVRRTSGGVPFHPAIDNLAEQTRPTVRANRHKIGACLGVIVPLQSDRSTTMFVRIVCHS